MRSVSTRRRLLDGQFLLQSFLVVRVGLVERKPEDSVDRVGNSDQPQHDRPQPETLGQLTQEDREDGRQRALYKGEQQGECRAAEALEDAETISSSGERFVLVGSDSI